MSAAPHVAVCLARFAEKAGAALAVLEKTCLARLAQLGATYEVVPVPGTFELPTAAAAALQTGRFQAVIALGVVVRGETAHFEWVAGECARGLATLGRQHARPVIFGVLTTENTAQAEARAHLGTSFAEAAVSLHATLRQLAGDTN